MKNNTVLIIDDEEDIRNLIIDILTEEGFYCIGAANSDEALSIVDKSCPHLILLDIWLEGSNMDGLGILEVLAKTHPNVPVIMISGHGTIETAVNSMKLGAYDYLEKPFTPDKLILKVKRTSELTRLKEENKELRKKIIKRSEIIGSSNAISKVKSIIEKVAPTSSRILISGEIGAGKELLAKIIHKNSKQKKFSFITINASTLSNDALQKDLFDNFKLIDLIKNGTLFINEVGKLPLHIQHKILKLVKEQSDSDKNNFRIIASTSMDLKNIVKKGDFLQELFYKLSTVSITMPSLRERREDIPELCSYFMSHLEKVSNLSQRELTPKIIEILISYEWPGNVRQLKNVIEWLLINAHIQNSHTITSEMLPNQIINNGKCNNLFEMNVDIMSMPLRQARELFERKYLTAQMVRFNNNISKTSTFVGMERSALHRKLKLLNVHNNIDLSTVDME
ncbi:MAG: sigma-54-dependent Fis family transcriptional regulator [Rickettsiales bacterium]|nr:sigma-54-dependent Fis family transcriptional regulator [Rickettsiales bacterium]